MAGSPGAGKTESASELLADFEVGGRRTFLHPSWRTSIVRVRNAAEGRRIVPESLANQYFDAKNVVDTLKRELGSRISVDLLQKPIDGSERLFKGGVDQIDYHVPETLDPVDGCTQMNLLKCKPENSSELSEFSRNASAKKKKQVYSRVLKRAADRQRETLERASKSSHA